MDCSSPPGSSVHEISQARIVKWMHPLPQTIFLTQGSNLGLLHLWRRKVTFPMKGQGLSLSASSLCLRGTAHLCLNQFLARWQVRLCVVVVQPAVTLPVTGFRCVPSATMAFVCWRTQETCPGIDPLFISFLQSHTQLWSQHKDTQTKARGFPKQAGLMKSWRRRCPPFSLYFFSATPSPKRDFRQCVLF